MASISTLETENSEISENSENSQNSDIEINKKVEIIQLQLKELTDYLKINKKTVSEIDKLDKKRIIKNLRMKIFRLQNKEHLQKYYYNQYHNIKKHNKDFLEYHKLATQKYRAKLNNK